MSTSQKPCMLWSCVARNEIILAEANLPDSEGTAEIGKDSVAEAACHLLQKKPTPGWEYSTLRQRANPFQKSSSSAVESRTLKGIKFHIYDHDGETGDFRVWVFAAVYNPAQVEQVQAQSFLEKIVTVSEMWRDTDASWKFGPALAAQNTFAPILLQRMEEISYLGQLAMVNQKVDSLKEVMARNVELILERGERLETLQEDASRLEEMASVFKKKSKGLKRRMLLQNAKHGVVLGTVITAGVAILVVPPLVAIL